MLKSSRRRVLEGLVLSAGISSLSAADVERGARPRATFVLVHGAWHGGWCYSRVAEMLRAQGHRVYTPTLTGLGERSHLARICMINCKTHINDILSVIRWEQLYDVVLCGHSYGGAIIGAVADAVPERVSALVYLDAIVPQDAASVLDLFEPNDLLVYMKPLGDSEGYLIPPPPAVAFNVNPADRAMVDALCTPQPFATLAERIKLGGAYMNVPKKTYVIATRWKGSPYFNQTYDRLKQDVGWTVVEIDSGHDVMLDEPAKLAGILLRSCGINRNDPVTAHKGKPR